MSDRPKQRRGILGVGNVLLCDEGAGVHAVRRLERSGAPPGISLFDGGIEGFGLMDIVAEQDRLVVIDCVRGGEEPGTIYRFEAEDVTAAPDRYQTSLHQVGILEILHFVELVGRRPRTTVVGIEPLRVEIGEKLSDLVAARLPRLGELAIEQVLAD
ncbi:MAG: HyaD/HybD family hydrogenase maturation endopeptidase [Polyangia bacterium]